MFSKLITKTKLKSFNFKKVSFYGGDCCPIIGNTKAVVRHKAPAFSGKAFWNNEFKKISLDDFNGKWVVLFFYPLDNTFVCPTEIVSFSDNHKKFEDINTQLIGCSVDSHFSHREWANKPRDQGGLSPLKIPLLSDISQIISSKYGVRINDENDDLQGVSLRGTFIIDPKGVLRHISINDLPVGRNVDEVLRLVKAFQFTDKHGEVCPASWNDGKKTIPVGNSEGVKEFWKNEHSKKH